MLIGVHASISTLCTSAQSRGVSPCTEGCGGVRGRPLIARLVSRSLRRGGGGGLGL